jgi:hypothetical protein
MKFLTKMKKTDDEKYQEWFNKAKRQVESKYFVTLWASMESQKDVTFIDRMINEGYELITIFAISFEGTRIVFKKPRGKE